MRENLISGGGGKKKSSESEARREARIKEYI